VDSDPRQWSACDLHPHACPLFPWPSAKRPFCLRRHSGGRAAAADAGGTPDRPPRPDPAQQPGHISAALPSGEFGCWPRATAEPEATRCHALPCPRRYLSQRHSRWGCIQRGHALALAACRWPRMGALGSQHWHSTRPLGGIRSTPEECHRRAAGSRRRWPVCAAVHAPSWGRRPFGVKTTPRPLLRLDSAAAGLTLAPSGQSLARYRSRFAFRALAWRLPDAGLGAEGRQGTGNGSSRVSSAVIAPGAGRRSNLRDPTHLAVGLSRIWLRSSSASPLVQDSSVSPRMSALPPATRPPVATSRTTTLIFR